MTTLTWPASLRAPQRLSWRIVPNTQMHVSPLDKSTQTQELPGARWRADAAWAVMVEEQWRIFQAFVVRLRGPAGRFYWGPPSPAGLPRGAATGSPVIAGAGQTGSSLATSGWTPGIAGILKCGDYFSFDNPLGGRELKVVRADVDSDGGGLATITFDPPIRRSPNDLQAITTTRPTCIMKLLDDNQGGFDFEQARMAQTNLTFIEHF